MEGAPRGGRPETAGEVVGDEAALDHHLARVGDAARPRPARSLRGVDPRPVAADVPRRWSGNRPALLAPLGVPAGYARRSDQRLGARGRFESPAPVPWAPSALRLEPAGADRARCESSTGWSARAWGTPPALGSSSRSW